MRDARPVWIAAGGLLALGCVALAFWFLRESEPAAMGTVRLGDKPLTTGSIAWIPIEGTSGPGGGGGINSAGKYEVTRGLRPGKYRVEIRSSTTLKNRQVRNSTIPSELVDEEVSVVSDQYNSKSCLIREVSPGSNVYDFDLKTIAASK
jgi:hypothetical protein